MLVASIGIGPEICQILGQYFQQAALGIKPARPKLRVEANCEGSIVFENKKIALTLFYAFRENGDLSLFAIAVFSGRKGITQL